MSGLRAGSSALQSCLLPMRPSHGSTQAPLLVTKAAGGPLATHSHDGGRDQLIGSGIDQEVPKSDERIERISRFSWQKKSTSSSS